MDARARLSAVVLIALLVGSTVLVAVPSGQATHAVTPFTVSVETSKDGIQKSGSSLVVINSGTTMFINVTATPTTGCANGNIASFSLTADVGRYAPTAVTGGTLSSDGSTLTFTLTPTSPDDGSPSQGRASFVVGGRAAGSANIDPDRVTVTATYACTVSVGDGTVTTPKTTTNAWLLDNTVPNLDLGTSLSNNTLDDPSITKWRQRVDVITVRVGANDSGGIDKFVFSVIYPSNKSVVKGLDGQPLTVTCNNSATTPPVPVATTNGCWLTPPLPVGATNYHYENATLRAGAAAPPKANLSFAKAPLGRYELQMSVFDPAGNVNTTPVLTAGALRTPVNITFGPRVVIPAGNATVGTDRKITASAYAAWTNETMYIHPDKQPCIGTAPDKICKVSKVLFQVRSAGSTTVTDLTPAIIAATDQIHSINGLSYYNYSIGAPVGQERTLPSGIDPNGAEIRAKVTVDLSATSSVEIEGPWIRLAATSTTENFVVSKPAVGGSYAFDPTASAGLRRVGFNVTYDEGGLTTPPNISYRVIRHTTGQPDQPVRFNSTFLLNPPSDHVSYISTPTGAVPAAAPTRYYYNWNNSDDLFLAEGAYTLHANISTSSGMRPFSRTFFVEHQQPTAKLNDTTGNPAIDNPEVHGGQHVRSPFKVSYLIDHGFARINATSLKLTLDNATQFYLPSTTWSYALTSLTPVNATASAANFTVSLPTILIDGALHTLRLNVTTEAYHLCKCDQDKMANGSVVKTVAFDGAPPFGAASAIKSAETGAPARELVVSGFAQDNGTGVRDVEVRIFNVTGNATYNFYENKFTAGEQGLWLTSERIPTAPEGQQFTRPIWIDRSDGRSPGAPEAVRWLINTTNRPLYGVNNELLGNMPAMPLDRASKYRIDLRVIDNVSRVSAINSTNVTFDASAPTINSFVGPSSNVTTWHVSTRGQKVLSLNVSDNYCVARVSLYGRSQAGTLVGPENFERPEGARCSNTAGGEARTWTFDLAAHPNFTNEVGFYELWAEAADPVGNTVTTKPKTFNLTVTDGFRPVVNYVVFRPNPVPAGTSTQVHINVFENFKLDRVEVDIIAPNGTIMGHRNLSALEGNGSGTYIIGTGSSEGLATTLEVGTYTVRARAIEPQHAGGCSVTVCPYENGTLLVVAEGAPQIQLDSPALGSHVNMTPKIKFSVLGRGIEAANVTVRAGNSTANATVVSATFTPLAAGSASGGLNGVLSPTGLVPGQTLVVLVSATKGGVAATPAEWTFRVDGTPPVVTLNVTGTAEIDGKNYTTTATKVFINSTDDVGLTTTTYTTSNGLTTSAPLTYASSITPAPATSDTLWKLEYTVSDAAGNAVRGNLTLNVDRLGPVVTVAKHGDDLVFTAVDAGVGIQGNVTVFYSYNNTGAYESVDGTSFTGNSYEAHLRGNASATGLRYYFVARDRLGNTGGLANHTALNPYVVPKDNATGGVNVPPVVRITSPAPGAVLRDAVDIAWTAEDADGDALTITIATRQPREEVIAPGITNGTTYRHAINDTDSGVWTIVVTASDGVNSASATVTFTVPAGDTIRVVNNPPVTVQLGQQVPFSVAIISPGKTVAQANFQIVDSTGKVFTAGQLTQSGAGVYAGTTQMTRPGDFRVLVDVIYADGTQEPSKDLGVFNVPVPAALKGEMWPISAQLIVLLGPVTMLLAAVGAFWRWRK